MAALSMTEGSGWKHVAKFSLPLMFGNLFQQLYNTVDGIVVGQFISESALGAIGNCATMTFVYLAIAFGLSNGAGIAISQYYGAKRFDDMKQCASTAFVLLAGVGVFVSIVGYMLTTWFLHSMMNIPEGEVLTLGITYLSIYSAGLIFQFIYNIQAAILRAVGDSKATLYFLCITTGLNALLDVVFVVAFNWGVAGTAIATVLSQFICVLLSAFYMYKKYPLFRFKIKELRYDTEKGKICLKFGVPTMLQQSVVAFGGVFMQRLVNHFGDSLMAAFTVGNRVENYVFIPVMALNAGMSTFTGQNMGAGKPDRVRECWKKIELLSFVLTFIIASVAFFGAGEIASLFGVKGESYKMATEMIRFMSYFTCLFAFYLPTAGLLQGSGDTFYAMFCSLSTLGTRVILAYVLVYAFSFGYQAAWYPVPVGWALCVALAVGRYLSGKWETKSVTRRV